MGLRCFPLLQPQWFPGTSDGKFMLRSFGAGLNYAEKKIPEGIIRNGKKY